MKKNGQPTASEVAEEVTKITGDPAQVERAKEITAALQAVLNDVLNAIPHTESQRTVIVNIFQAHAKQYATQK